MVVLIACIVARKSMSDGVRYVKEPWGREIGVGKPESLSAGLTAWWKTAIVVVVGVWGVCEPSTSTPGGHGAVERTVGACRSDRQATGTCNHRNRHALEVSRDEPSTQSGSRPHYVWRDQHQVARQESFKNLATCMRICGDLGVREFVETARRLSRFSREDRYGRGTESNDPLGNLDGETHVLTTPGCV